MKSIAELPLKVVLGRAEMPLEDLVELRAGSLVALDKRVDDPVDVIVGGRLVARGEVVIIDEKLCVRITELVEGQPLVHGI